MRTELIVLLGLLAIAYAGDFSSAQYQAKTAEQKMKQIWSEVTSDTTPYGWYSKPRLLTIFFEDMKPSFDHYSDTVPSGRKKLIHSVGSIAKAEFVAEKTEYTGMFEGVKHALIRISLAKQPDYTKAPLGNFAPGMGIKLLRDGVPSANLVAMYATEGQDSFNVFENDWSHHIGSACKFAFGLLCKKFATASPIVGKVGLKTWGEYDEKGEQVDERYIKVPFRLIFRPTEEVKNLFPKEYQAEFTAQLATIPAGTPLFDVYAADYPHDVGRKIGQFVMKSEFTTSKFADKDLFFQHNYIEDDIELNPSWKSKYSDSQVIDCRLIE